MVSVVETQAGWRHASDRQQFNTPFTCGSNRHSVAAYNATEKKAYSPRDQMGGTAMVKCWRAVSSVRSTDR